MQLNKRVFYTLFILLFGYVLSASEVMQIKSGILDLRGKAEREVKEIEIAGEWEFYWNRLVYPNEIFNDKNTDVNFIKVPSVWKSHRINGELLPGKGLASYRIQILSDSGISRLAIKTGTIGTAFKLFVDEELIAQAGVVSHNKKIAESGYATGVYPFQIKSDTTEVIFQISNYNYSKGGLWNNYTKVGNEAVLKAGWDNDLHISLMLAGAIFIFALYHLGLYFLNRNFRYTLYFSLFCVVIFFRTLVVGQVIMLHWFPDFNWEALIKIEYFTLIAGIITFSAFFYKFFEDEYSSKFLKFILTISIFQGLIILSSSPAFFTKLLIVNLTTVVLGAIYAVVVIIKAILSKRPHVIILLVGILIMLVTVVNDSLYSFKVIETAFLAQFGFVAFLFSQAYMLSARFSQLFVQTEILAQRLEATNINLEKLVEKRTSKIQEQNALLMDQKNQILETNSALEQQNDEIKAQRDNLQRQKEIVEQQKKQITGSINYASRIQSAVLDSANEQHKVAPDSFILFHPKDIVSGDFYWFKEIDLGKRRLKIAAVIDCTGHGVPGAFMSILGAMFLSKIINELTPESDASTILNKMRFEVKRLLNQQSTQSIVKDGMDMALVIIDYHTMTMHYAGAHNPLIIIRHTNGAYLSEIEEYKGDKMPIGIYVREKDSFTNHTIDLNKNDLIYLFSDGYYDQFGGEKGEKLKKRTFKDLLLKNAHLPLSKQKLILEHELFKWRGDFDQIDDITVVGMRV